MAPSSEQLDEIGARRVHLNTGEVWSVVGRDAAGAVVDLDIEPECGSLAVARERRRRVHLDYWLGSNWGEPVDLMTALEESLKGIRSK